MNHNCPDCREIRETDRYSKCERCADNNRYDEDYSDNLE
jgi:hypothetical protein